jgi:hypothetical protein
MTLNSLVTKVFSTSLELLPSNTDLSPTGIAFAIIAVVIGLGTDLDGQFASINNSLK